MARHALERPGRVDEFLHARVRLVEIGELPGELERVVERDVLRARPGGHELGHDIHLGIGHVERAAHVADDGARRHRPERHDLGDVVVAVFAADVVHDLAAARVAEIHVDIGHGHALRVQEALEIEAVLHWVDVRDVQAVRHH